MNHPPGLRGLVAIDLDGTLVDSAPDMHVCLGDSLAAIGLQRPGLEATRSWIGNGIEQLVQRALAAQGCADQELFSRALQRYFERYGENLFTLSRLYAGVPQTLSALRERGYRLACITNKRLAFSEQLLRLADIHSQFEFIYGGDSFPEKKPHPKPLLAAAHRSGLSAGECVMVGDSAADLHAARAAGFQFIWASFGYGHSLPAAATQDLVRIRQFPELLHRLP